MGPSVFWAGGERVRLQIGLPSMSEQALGTMFTLDPRVKEEYIWPSGTKKRVLMLKRDEPTAWLRNAEGNMVSYPFKISKSDSVLCQIIDPHLYPEISSVRSSILGWRFYHHFLTDSESPLRQPRIGVQTTVLSQDGSDLAAALPTIIEIGDDRALNQAVQSALGGAILGIQAEDTPFKMRLQIPGLLRPLQAREFSDGQLRFLCSAQPCSAPALLRYSH